MPYFDTDTLSPFYGEFVIDTTRGDAEAASLKAAMTCYDESPLDPFAVAMAVGREARLRAREARVADKPKKAPKLKTPSLLGCWVNGELKFQSRDHEAIRTYAADKMRAWTVRHADGSYYVKTNDVWVAPVGSFQK